MTIVHDWGSHFLRDDREIREGVLEPAEAYSLFRRQPYGRIEVFAGSLAWALAEAERRVEEDKR